MNRILNILFLMVLLIFAACKKEFNHKTIIEQNTDSACHLCNYADSLEGTYRGLVSYYPWQASADTVNIHVEHFFKSLGGQTDSTIMFFHLIQELIPSTAGYQTFTVSLDNPDGIFYETPIGDKLTIIGDSLHYTDFFIGIEDTILVYKFDGKKLP